MNLHVKRKEFDATGRRSNKRPAHWKVNETLEGGGGDDSGSVSRVLVAQLDFPAES